MDQQPCAFEKVIPEGKWSWSRSSLKALNALSEPVALIEILLTAIVGRRAADRREKP